MLSFKKWANQCSNQNSVSETSGKVNSSQIPSRKGLLFISQLLVCSITHHILAHTHHGQKAVKLPYRWNWLTNYLRTVCIANHGKSSFWKIHDCTSQEFPLWLRYDPMQKWLPLNYSFVHIQNSPVNLARDNKFFRIFVSKTRLVRLFWYEQKNNLKRPFLHRVYGFQARSFGLAWFLVAIL